MTILPDPTERQREVLDEHEDLLVVGAPGCGKTTVALAKAVSFIDRIGVGEHQAVLFLSFSNAAVHRIREAARGMIPRATLRKLEITTFHGLCFRILLAHRRLVGLGKPFRLLPPEDVSNLRSRMGDDEDALGAEFERLEREEGRVRFDRFTALIIQLFDRAPLIERTYANAFPLVIVDEYQDTSDEQDELVRRLGSHGQLVFLGDPDQRIYDFVEGTRSDRLQRTAARPGIHTVRLETNHRSGTNDIAVVGQAVLQGVKEIPKPSSVHLWGFGNRASQVTALKRAVVGVERYLDNNLPSHKRRSVAIMARTNSYVQGLSTALLETDEEWEFPFRHQVLLNPDATAIAWDAVMVLLAPGLSPSQQAAEILRAAARLNRLKVGVKSRTEQAERLERWAGDTEAGRLSGRAQAATQLLERVRRFAGEVSGDPVLDCRAAREVFRGLPGGNLETLTAVLDLRMPTGGISDLTGALGERFLDFGCYRGAREVAETALLKERMELGSYTRAPRVLMTMHKCKGKQFSAVIIVEGHKGADRLLWRSGQESRRLLHVAITRAEMKTVILTPAYDPSPLLPTFLESDD